MNQGLICEMRKLYLRAGHGRKQPAWETWWPAMGNRLPAVAATEGKQELTMENLAGEKQKRWKNSQTVMDSCEEIYHGVENEETYL